MKKRSFHREKIFSRCCHSNPFRMAVTAAIWLEVVDRTSVATVEAVSSRCWLLFWAVQPGPPPMENPYSDEQGWISFRVTDELA